MNINFKYNKETELLEISSSEQKYESISLISNWGWTSDRVIEDLEMLEQCRAGTYHTEDGQDTFYVGFENSPGIIMVGSDEDTAELYDANTFDKVYISLTLDELKDFLEQMRDFLISVGQQSANDVIDLDPTVSRVADIPLDTPFRAKIDIKSLAGKLFPKREISSMFPRNWSKERIQEEVAWVYESTVAKSDGFVRTKVNEDGMIIHQYLGKSTTGFDILIELDEAKNIINAYPFI